MGGLVEESLHCLESSLADQRFDAIVDVLELVRGHLFPHRADDGYRGAHYLLRVQASGTASSITMIAPRAVVQALGPSSPLLIIVRSSSPDVWVQA